MQESIVFLVCVQCRLKESSRSLSHLLMSFLFYKLITIGLCYVQYVHKMQTENENKNKNYLEKENSGIIIICRYYC